VRAKQSSTAIGKHSNLGTFTPHISTESACGSLRIEDLPDRSCREAQTCPVVHGEGLLHDARNLVGAIGLYCDLLSMPGVLKPEHRQYPEELRLLGARSRALIEALMCSLLTLEKPGKLRVDGPAEADIQQSFTSADLPGAAGKTLKAVSLRSIVERCSGLLSRVASGRELAIDYGPAAATPVKISEEAVERILVNLVRNAAAAVCEGAAGGACGTIRITLGMLASRVGELKPWPFQRVRLSVEDSGCGMNPEQLDCLLHGEEPSGDSHGIGFRVVRELAATSDGELQVTSKMGAGTRVQIEWPVAATFAPEVMGWGELRGQPSESLPAECRSRRLGDLPPQPEMEGVC
jgi:signal transduction histidine kinase